jgi:hypothetical protein
MENKLPVPGVVAKPVYISCSGGCKKTWLANDIDKSGWSLLEISGRYRCPTCTHLLHGVSFIPGTRPGDFIDKVPPNSRGALPKETASTISPPVLKG